MHRGDPVAVRSVRIFGRHGKAVTFAVAGTVVTDSHEVVVVSTSPGSDLRTRAGRGSGPNDRIVPPDAWDGSYTASTWHGNSVVRVHRWGESWSIWRWHDGTAWCDGWYGNLETPWQRSSTGYDTDDWTLDVIASGVPGSAHWSVGYKDEDELEWSVSSGLMDAARADSTREAGRRLTHAAVSLDWPFSADWSEWVPDPSWGSVRLPQGWDKVSARGRST